MAEELRSVTAVGNEAEAEMVVEWLSEAGIRSVPQLSSGNIRLGAAAPRDVYVEAKDYDRALEVINAEVPSEAELAALSDAAVAQQTQPKGTDKDGEPYEPADIPVPKRSAFDRLIGRAENTPPRNRP
jgi:Putative prokaryotic signal transducing protein